MYIWNLGRLLYLANLDEVFSVCDVVAVKQTQSSSYLLLIPFQTYAYCPNLRSQTSMLSRVQRGPGVRDHLNSLYFITFALKMQKVMF